MVADTRYLYWATQDRSTWPLRGSAQPFIAQGDARAVRVLLPAIEEQRAIAATLGALDDKIESNRRAIRMGHDLLHVIFERALAHPDVMMLAFEDVVERLPVKQKHNGKTVSPSGRTAVLDQSSGGILGFSDRASEFDASLGDPICLFGDHTCTWRLAIGKFDVGPNVVPVRSHARSPVNTMWLYFSLYGVQESEEYRRHWMEFKIKEIPWVSAEVQDEFVRTARPVLALSNSLELECRQLAALRDALLPELLSGRIRVAEAADAVAEATT